MRIKREDVDRLIEQGCTGAPTATAAGTGTTAAGFWDGAEIPAPSDGDAEPAT